LLSQSYSYGLAGCSIFRLPDGEVIFDLCKYNPVRSQICSENMVRQKVQHHLQNRNPSLADFVETRFNSATKYNHFKRPVTLDFTSKRQDRVRRQNRPKQNQNRPTLFTVLQIHLSIKRYDPRYSPTLGISGPRYFKYVQILSFERT
jgi:hypothetical protein